MRASPARILTHHRWRSGVAWGWLLLRTAKNQTTGATIMLCPVINRLSNANKTPIECRSTETKERMKWLSGENKCYQNLRLICCNMCRNLALQLLTCRQNCYQTSPRWDWCVAVLSKPAGWSSFHSAFYVLRSAFTAFTACQVQCRSLVCCTVSGAKPSEAIIARISSSVSAACRESANIWRAVASSLPA